MTKGSRLPVLSRLLITIGGYFRLLIARDTPWKVRLILAAALVYLVLHYDLLPDWFLGLGIIDDAVVVSALVWLALRLLNRDGDTPGK